LLASSLSKAVIFLDLSYQHIAEPLAQLLEAGQGCLYFEKEKEKRAKRAHRKAKEKSGNLGDRCFSVARIHREGVSERPHRVGGYEFGPLKDGEEVEEGGCSLVLVGVYPQPMFSSILLNYGRCPVAVCDPVNFVLETSPVARDTTQPADHSAASNLSRHSHLQRPRPDLGACGGAPRHHPTWT